MSGAQLIPGDDGVWRLRGELSFASVPEMLSKSAELFAAGGDLVLDLQDVDAADSAGLALLLEWLAMSQQRKQRLQLRNLPKGIQAIADMSNLGPLLERMKT